RIQDDSGRGLPVIATAEAVKNRFRPSAIRWSQLINRSETISATVGSATVEVSRPVEYQVAVGIRCITATAEFVKRGFPPGGEDRGGGCRWRFQIENCAAAVAATAVDSLVRGRAVQAAIRADEPGKFVVAEVIQRGQNPSGNQVCQFEGYARFAVLAGAGIG